MLANGGEVVQETRHFDESSGSTSPGRKPEPDLVPVAPSRQWVSYLAQQVNTRGVELTDLPITPAQVARARDRGRTLLVDT